MKKNLKIFWQLFRINMKQSMIYRINFLITILSMGMWIFIYVGFFEVLFLKIDNLAGWEKDEILIFLAFYYLLQGIGNILYRESFEDFSNQITHGLIDNALTKPASAQVLLFFRTIRFDHIIDLLLTILLILYILLTTNINLNPLSLILGIILGIFGNLLFYGFLLLFSSIVFYVDKFDSIPSLLWHVSQISRYPRQIFTGFGKLLFQFILPITLIVSVPAEVALERSNYQIILYFIGISIIFFLIGNIAFNRGLKKYTSSN